jgi:hypothetical protein
VVFQSRPVSSSPVYPAGRVGTPADPNIPPGGYQKMTDSIFDACERTMNKIEGAYSCITLINRVGDPVFTVSLSPPLHGSNPTSHETVAAARSR